MPVPVCLTFDNMGLAADVGRGLAHDPDPDEPGLRTAYPALLDMLARHQAKATFFVEGWNGLHHPDRVAELSDHGHEVGAHGWVHEPWGTLEEDEESVLLDRSIEALTSCGVSVTGFRAPGGTRTANTLRLLRERGLTYDASLDPAGFRRSAEGVVILPFEWPDVDWHWFGAQDPPAPPAAFQAALWGALERAHDRDEPLVVVAHARTSMLVDDRAHILDTLIRKIGTDPRFRLMRMGDLAATWPE